MITFKLKKETVKQLKKFISGLIPKKEDLYLYVNEKDEVYLVSFNKDHIYIAYLLLGVSKDISKGAKIIQGDYNDLKKFIRNVKADDELKIEPYDYNIKVELQHKNSNGETNTCNLYYNGNEDINIDLDLFRGLTDKEFKINKKDFKALELYPTEFSRFSIKEEKIRFEFYNKDYNIFSEHIIYDVLYEDKPDQNDKEGTFNLANKCLLNILKKFNAEDPIRLILDDGWPLLIEAGDFIGILAPRILEGGDLRRLI